MDLILSTTVLQATDEVALEIVSKSSFCWNKYLPSYYFKGINVYLKLISV